MAIIEINFKDVKKELQKDYTLEEFECILLDCGFEIDNYNKDTGDLKVDVTAERFDVLSKTGLFRVLKIFTGVEKIKNYSVKKGNYVLNIDDSVKEVRPYSVCAVVKNLKLNSEKLKEIILAQEKLHLTLGRKRTLVAIGVYPLEKIEFPISFVSKKPEDIKFIPLGEIKELTAKQILKETETGKEFSSLLELKEKYPIFVDNRSQILSMPPIINSEITGKVTENTSEIFIECSGFDQNKLNQALNLLCALFFDFGAEIYTVDINYGKSYSLKPKTTPLFVEEKRLIFLKHINSLIGINITIDTACLLLEKMSYKCKKYGKENIEVSIPIFRTDILHEVDIIDDISRAYGISNIKLKLPKVFTIGSVLKETKKQETIVDLMAQLGFVETSPLSLSSKKEAFENFGLDFQEGDAIELGYSKDKEIDIVCPNHLPKLMKILLNNQHRLFPQNIFVCDQVVVPDKTKENKAIQKLMLSAVTADSKNNFTEMVSVVFSLCNFLGLHLELKDTSFPFYLPGRCAKIIINNECVGHIGELHPKVLSNFNYQMPVVCFEIVLTDF